MYVYRERERDVCMIQTYTYVCVYIYIYMHIHYYAKSYITNPDALLRVDAIHPAAVRCDMVLHHVCCAILVRKAGTGGVVRHGVTPGVLCETSKT